MEETRLSLDVENSRNGPGRKIFETIVPPFRSFEDVEPESTDLNPRNYHSMDVDHSQIGRLLRTSSNLFSLKSTASAHQFIGNRETLYSVDNTNEMSNPMEMEIEPKIPEQLQSDPTEGSLQDEAAFMDDESVPSQTLLYMDDCMRLDFSVDFPLSVAQTILENSTTLANYVLPLKGTYCFEAGFDSIPAHCTLALPELSNCFQGRQFQYFSEFFQGLERCYG